MQTREFLLPFLLFLSLTVSRPNFLIYFQFHFISENSIVDVNASLVDDGLVEKDKIGGSNFFWSFPGKRDRMLQLDHERVLAETELAKGRIAEAEAKLADAKRGREDEDGERPKKLAKLIELGKKKEQLLKELETLKANDPQSLADSEKELKLVREGAERWTDNIFKVSHSLGQLQPFLFTHLFFSDLQCCSFIQ